MGARWYFDFTTELLWKMPIDGGQPTQITNKRSDRTYISPDGKFIACGYETEVNTPMKIAIIGIDGGPPVKIFNVPATVVVDDLAWTPDGRAITYVYTTNGVSNLWVQPLDGTTARQFTDFTSDRMSSFDFSPDGKTLALARGNSRTDVVLFNRID